MKFSEQWLRALVNPNIDSTQLVEQLTMAGLEVDSIEPVAPDFSKVVVGEVLSVESHPEADRLQVCQVNIGQNDPLQIVCGAKNVTAGVRYPTAVVGALLPGGLKIKKAKLRGVVSQGMLCAENELGFEQQTQGIMPLPNDAPIGQDFREYYQLDDTIIDVDLTPNRGDCLSMRGLAREVAALNRCQVDAQINPVISATIKESINVSLKEKEACPRYCGRVIANINATATSPLWLTERLRRGGIRSIHPVVDVTNYVMLELGQPMHAFDMSKLQGDISVRHANKAETLALLDGQTIELNTNSLVIADQKHVLALAGIMGGQDSAVDEKTQSIFLESAFFTPQSVTQSVQYFRIHSDSSHRFERGVDPFIQELAIERATELLLEIVGGQPGPVTCMSAGEGVANVKQVTLRCQRIQRILGIDIADQQVEEILQGLGMDIINSKEGWVVNIPSHRFDISAEIDLIEEVARIHGYDAIPYGLPLVPAKARAESDSTAFLNKIRQLMSVNNYHEAISYSFVDGQKQQLINPQGNSITLANPLAPEMAVMRTSLLPGLIDALQYNRYRQQDRVRLFELGMCFNQAEQLLQENYVAAVITGSRSKEQWNVKKQSVDFFDIKGDLQVILALTGHPQRFELIKQPDLHPGLHPGQSAMVVLDSTTVVGYVGAIHPQVLLKLDINSPVYAFELNLERLGEVSLPQYKAWSKFPQIRRDISLLVDKDLPAAKIQKKIAEMSGDLLKNVQIFDIYQGEHIDLEKKSIALGLTFQHESRTLVDGEINEMMQLILKELQQTFNATLR